ncbi:MerR family transcriptional regulator [Nonomuraea typhae]|uniref:MerR family transcriptional regulator n=1 Tax=Nonomuraea typhae TaxID=2603600 RepID=A0ABW7YM40_9ACTN
MNMLVTRGDGLWTTAQAAQHAKVKPGTIRQWVSRGHLAKAGLDEKGHPLFDPIEVAKAEYATHKHARRDVNRLERLRSAAA